MSMKVDPAVLNMEYAGTELTITRPDDWHLHLRDGVLMQNIVGYSAARFGRALIMPNLKPPVTTVKMAAEYRERILSAVPKGSDFEPLMTLYLTDNTSPYEIDRAADSDFMKAVKLYPAGATTNSDAGVTDIRRVHLVLERMQKLGMVLCVHGEVADPTVDIFDREAVFIDKVLRPLRKDFPELKTVLEHITTKQGVQFISHEERSHHPTAATITAHHLLLNRNALFAGGIRPHHYCLPVLKREEHRLELVKAATSGNPRFFLGTDSASHAKDTKEAACGCAGCYTAHAAIELYAEVFEEEEGALDKLEGFASHFGADFYGLPRNKGKITLVKEPWQVQMGYSIGDNNSVVPLRAGEDGAVENEVAVLYGRRLIGARSLFSARMRKCLLSSQRVQTSTRSRW